MINRKINKVNHPIYESIEEFRKYNPNINIVKNWRDGKEGDWIVSDDGQVCQVLKRGELKHRKDSKIIKNYIRAPLGTFLCKDNI